MAEEMIGAGAPIAASWFADRQMGPALIAYGTEDQQQRVPPRDARRRDTTWCIGMSEPDAGSDLASLKTFGGPRRRSNGSSTARRSGRRFAAVADYCYLICRTTTEGPPHRGVSEIIVPMDLPGIEVRPDHRHDDQPALLRGVLHRRASADREPGRSRGRRLQADDGASSSTSGAASTGSCRNRPLYDRARRSPTTDPIRSSARRSPRSRPATGSVGSSSTARRSARPRPGSAPPPSASAPSTSSGWPTSRPGCSVMAATADADAGQGHRLRPRLHDHGRHLERDAQHPGRTGPRPSPRAQAALKGVGRPPSPTSGTGCPKAGLVVRPRSGSTPASPYSRPEPETWCPRNGAPGLIPWRL